MKTKLSVILAVAFVSQSYAQTVTIPALATFGSPHVKRYIYQDGCPVKVSWNYTPSVTAVIAVVSLQQIDSIGNVIAERALRTMSMPTDEMNYVPRFVLAPGEMFQIAIKWRQYDINGPVVASATSPKFRINGLERSIALNSPIFEAAFTKNVGGTVTKIQQWKVPYRTSGLPAGARLQIYLSGNEQSRLLLETDATSGTKVDLENVVPGTYTVIMYYVTEYGYPSSQAQTNITVGSDAAATTLLEEPVQ